MANVDFSSSSGKWNGTNGSGQVLLYDANGNPVTLADRAAVSATQQGMPIMGVDNGNMRLLRASPDAALQTNSPYLMLYDSTEGAAVDTNKWIQTTTTMTITQAAATGRLFNATSSVATTVGAMLTSVRKIPCLVNACTRYRTRVRHTGHFANNLIEHGFGSPASATSASIVNGAVWRKDGTGQYVPCITVNGGSDILGTPISNATFLASVPATDYFEIEVQVWLNRCVFSMWTNTGVLINSQTIDMAGTGVPGFAVTHLQVLDRIYNAGATGTAVQLFVANNTIDMTDRDQHNQPWASQMAGITYGGISSPTAYTQLANWTNSGAPTTRTLANATAAETTLGGLIRVNSIAGGVTDYIMFGFQVPTPYTFFFTGISIPAPLNEVVAVATTGTAFQYFLGFNGTAVSLATAGIYRKALAGYHSAAVATAANVQFLGDTIKYYPTNPIPIFAGRFFHVGCREILGTATATETYYWPGVTIDGYFE